MFWIHLDIGQVAQIIWTYVISVMSNKSFSRFPCWIMDMKTLERIVLRNRIIDFPKRLCASFFYPRQLTCFCVFLNLKTLHCLTACSGGGGCGNHQQTKFFAYSILQNGLLWFQDKKSQTKCKILVMMIMRCGFNQYCPRCHCPLDPSQAVTQPHCLPIKKFLYLRNSGSRHFYFWNVYQEILDHQDGFIKEFLFWNVNRKSKLNGRRFWTNEI